MSFARNVCVTAMEATTNFLKKYQITHKQCCNVVGVKCRQTNDRNRTCYKFVLSKVIRSKARAYCQGFRNGGDLVSIESENEQIFLADLILGECPAIVHYTMAMCSSNIGDVCCIWCSYVLDIIVPLICLKYGALISR